MRVSFVFACLIAIVIVPVAASGGPTVFPYEAVVEQEGVVVRSGPGERYDPTLKLSTGQQVTVHKHEPGGWFMVSPPPGSFSWIDAAYVERTGPETGVVKVPHQGNGLPPRVAVWIGSQFTDEHRYYGRQLAGGDEVRILGEKTGQSERGPTTYLKIAPPRHEFRWVKGDFIVPVGEPSHVTSSQPVRTPTVSASPRQSDPFASSLSAEQTMAAPGFPPEQTSTLVERELSRGIDADSLDSSLPSAKATPNERSRLYGLDAQFKAMIAQTPDHWDLDSVERAYRQLRASSGAGVGAQIDVRLAAIESRRRIKSEYDAFVEVTSRTEQRDAELFSLQQSLAGGSPPSPLPVVGQAPRFQSLPADDRVPPSASTWRAPAIGPQTPHGSTPAAVPSMDGAGIVQRLPHPRPGLPQHALVAPDGRLLAYLQAGQGVKLDGYIGQSIGVIGRRSHDPRLSADLIIVERLTPVQLQP